MPIKLKTSCVCLQIVIQTPKLYFANTDSDLKIFMAKRAITDAKLGQSFS